MYVLNIRPLNALISHIKQFYLRFYILTFMELWKQFREIIVKF